MLNGRTICYVSVISYNVFIRIHNIPSSRLSLVQNHSRGKIFHARSSKKIPSRKFSFFVRFLSPSFLDSLESKDPFPPEETVIYLGRPMIPRAIHERIRRIVLDGSLVAGAHTRRGRRGVEEESQYGSSMVIDTLCFRRTTIPPLPRPTSFSPRLSVKLFMHESCFLPCTPVTCQ